MHHFAVVYKRQRELADKAGQFRRCKLAQFCAAFSTAT
jgi:hypothetical protein